MANRIELEGRLARAPELRVTPAGTPVLKLAVECAEPGEQLRLEVVMAGEAAQAIAPLLKRGSAVAVAGRLRACGARTIGSVGVELIANRIEPQG